MHMSTSEVTRSGSFAAAPARLWELVSNFGGLADIMDGIDSCTVEGEGIGAKRSLVMGGGPPVVESLDVLDHDAMTLTYSILEAPLPFKDYSATMVVSAEGDGSSLAWTGTFEPDGVPAEKAEGLAGGIYDAGIAGFRKALGE